MLTWLVRVCINLWLCMRIFTMREEMLCTAWLYPKWDDRSCTKEMSVWYDMKSTQHDDSEGMV